MLMFPAALMASNEVANQTIISENSGATGLVNQALANQPIANQPLVNPDVASPLANKMVSVQETLVSAAPALNTQDQLIQVSLSLVAVLVVIYALAWLIKRNRGIQGLTGLPMKTLAVLPMGVKEKIVLIEVGGKQILLGLTAHNINTLASFDEPILVIKDKNPKSFSDRLKDIMSQVKQDNAQEDSHKPFHKEQASSEKINPEKPS